MELLFVVLKKHSAVDIVGYICCMVIFCMTNHVHIYACKIVQLLKVKIIGFVYNCFIYKLVEMVVFIVQTKA